MRVEVAIAAKSTKREAYAGMISNQDLPPPRPFDGQNQHSGKGAYGGGSEAAEKTDVRDLVRREWRVMFSRKRSPLPLRLAKWIVFLGIARRLYGTRWFKIWVLGLPLAGVATHLLYRHGTRAWTRPWGGWKDIESAKPKGAR